jgi:hypothetical protein
LGQPFHSLCFVLQVAAALLKLFFSGPFGKFHQVYLVDINLKRKEDQSLKNAKTEYFKKLIARNVKRA